MQGDCGLCKYHTIGDGGSIDFLMDEYELDVEDIGSNPEDIVGEALLLEELLKELDEIDPDGRRIAEDLMDGATSLPFLVWPVVLSATANYASAKS